ncbi:hypothetical protein EZV62_024399 [Acer yangbiense]|uniref:Uncharacterized protein n=1 Tax=Acer yangbiense TaxID=1000413 RepID=A0A5C7GUQ0_9ROSI|nr:hypothetical protein EZV62_024399 [Acer yangbiense]
MSTGEIACSYAAMILHDDGIAITAEKIAALLNAANLSVESFWPSLFAKLADKRNLGDLIMNVGSGGGGGAAVAVAAPTGGAAAAAAPVVEEKKEEAKEESDDDMGFSFSFDALCAEFYGQKFDFSAAAKPKQEASLIKRSSGFEGNNKTEEQQQRRRRIREATRRPRFAPELDGVHCFETILPF